MLYQPVPLSGLLMLADRLGATVSCLMPLKAPAASETLPAASVTVMAAMDWLAPSAKTCGAGVATPEVGSDARWVGDAGPVAMLYQRVTASGLLMLADRLGATVSW